MKGVAMLLLLVLPSVAALRANSNALNSVDFDDKAWKVTPIQRVVALLKDMQATLEKEADSDQDLYDKLACWCETNDKGKTAAIATAKQMIADATATIEETTARNKELTTQIASLKEEIAENTASL